jgi:hypothetical protein
MAQFRKKPVVIEAIKVSSVLGAHNQQWNALPQWYRDAFERNEVRTNDQFATIRTLEGDMTAESTDWIIRGVKGELYPCKPDIFAATYEAVE